jgi:hypothetical protein
MRSDRRPAIGATSAIESGHDVSSKPDSSGVRPSATWK